MKKILTALSKFREYINTPPPTDEENKKLEEWQEREKKILRLKKEQDRETFEKYKIRKTGGWGCLPALLLFGCLIWILYNLFWGSKTIDLYFAIPVGLSLWISVLATDVANEWDAIVECKKEILSSDSKYNWDSGLYDEEYIYTDSLWDAIIYRFAQWISYFVTIGIVILLALFLIERIPEVIEGLSLKAIGIMIICLLLVVIHNQGRA